MKQTRVPVAEAVDAMSSCDYGYRPGGCTELGTVTTEIPTQAGPYHLVTCEGHASLECVLAMATRRNIPADPAWLHEQALRALTDALAALLPDEAAADALFGPPREHDDPATRLMTAWELAMDALDGSTR